MLKPNLGCSVMVSGKVNQQKICIGNYALFHEYIKATENYAIQDFL